VLNMSGDGENQVSIYSLCPKSLHLFCQESIFCASGSHVCGHIRPVLP